MANLITYYKAVRNDENKLEAKAVVLSGIAKDGIVLDNVHLNDEISESIQWFVNKSYENKLVDVSVKLAKAEEEADEKAIQELTTEYDELYDIISLLDSVSVANQSKYAFVNRIALAILNNRSFRVAYENDLLKALKIGGYGDSVEQKDLSTARKEVVEILNKIFEIKDCPYIKPIQVKLNLKEVAQLQAIANNTKARWTDKGIKVRTSKTIATEVALQCILYTCKNSFSMVIPTKKSTDDRTVI